MRQIITRYLPILFLSISLFSCNPKGAEYVDELDLVISFQDHEVDYSNYDTFTIADTIMFFSNDQESELSPKQEQLILTEINTHMKEYGWTEADTTKDTAEVLILVSVLENVNVSILTGWWDYWGGWWGWGYYPGSSWYYPGYPGYPGYGPCCYTSIYTYREGTIIVEMVDPNNPVDVVGQVPDKLPVLWAGGINGLLKGNTSQINSRIESTLDQLFSDSPYLNKK